VLIVRGEKKEQEVKTLSPNQLNDKKRSLS